MTTYTFTHIEEVYPQLVTDGVFEAKASLKETPWVFVAISDTTDTDTQTPSKLATILSENSPSEGTDPLALWMNRDGLDVNVTTFIPNDEVLEQLENVNEIYTVLLTQWIHKHLMIDRDQVFMLRTPRTIFVTGWPKGCVNETTTASYTLTTLSQAAVIRDEEWEVATPVSDNPSQQYITNTLLQDLALQGQYRVLCGFTRVPYFKVKTFGLMYLPFPECVLCQHDSGSVFLLAPSKTGKLVYIGWTEERTPDFPCVTVRTTVKDDSVDPMETITVLNRRRIRPGDGYWTIDAQHNQTYARFTFHDRTDHGNDFYTTVALDTLAQLAAGAALSQRSALLEFEPVDE